ncbi:Uma2 family endonuclease [Longispora urticae]
MSVAEVFDHSNQPWTEESYFALGETLNRIELFDGSLIGSPSASRVHQAISRRLANHLETAVAAEFEVNEAINLRLRQDRICIPDVVVIDDVPADPVEAEHVRFVAEIVSPGNPGNDRVVKFHVYAQAGIPWYLLVETEGGDLVLKLYRLESGAYTEHAVAKGDESLRITEPFTVDLCPNSLLRR